MEKTKKQMLNIILSILLIAILACITVGTYAWFTDQKSFSTGELKFGTIKIDVAGDSISGDKLNVVIQRSSGELTGNLMPGDTVSLKFNVALASNSEPAYYLVFLTGAENLFDESCFYYDGTTVKSATSTNKSVGALSTNPHAFNLTKQISTSFEAQGGKVSITLEVYAIQQANLTQEQAYDEIVKKYSKNNDEALQNTWENKTAVFVGDSITYGTGCTGEKYWEILKNNLKLSNVTNMGIAGSCISATSDCGLSNSPLISRYDSIPQADLITIFMGTNDYGHCTPLGTIDDNTDISFYGALKQIIASLQQKYKSSKIIFITPHHRYGFGGLNNDNESNSAGYVLEDYVNAIKLVCENYMVPVIDLYNISKIDPSVETVRNTYMPDGLHPNTDGHKYIASIMSHWFNLSVTSVVHGNKYVSGYTSSTNRISFSKNLYLKAGTVISLNDNNNYLWAYYNQTSEIQSLCVKDLSNGWVNTKSFTITNDGYYGFTLSYADKTTEFTFSNDNVFASYYVTITESITID